MRDVLHRLGEALDLLHLWVVVTWSKIDSQ
jgi:hypothetical protein